MNKGGEKLQINATIAVETSGKLLKKGEKNNNENINFDNLLLNIIGSINQIISLEDQNINLKNKFTINGEEQPQNALPETLKQYSDLEPESIIDNKSNAQEDNSIIKDKRIIHQSDMEIQNLLTIKDYLINQNIDANISLTEESNSSNKIFNNEVKSNKNNSSEFLYIKGTQKLSTKSFNTVVDTNINKNINEKIIEIVPEQQFSKQVFNGKQLMTQSLTEKNQYSSSLNKTQNLKREDNNFVQSPQNTFSDQNNQELKKTEVNSYKIKTDNQGLDIKNLVDYDYNKVKKISDYQSDTEKVFENKFKENSKIVKSENLLIQEEVNETKTPTSFSKKHYIEKTQKINKKQEYSFNFQHTSYGVESKEKQITNNVNITESNNTQNISNITEGIINNIEEINEGEKTILKVKLYPEELGEIKIHIEMEKGQLKGNIIVENHSIKEMLNENLEQLNNILKNNDVHFEKLDVGLANNFNGSTMHNNNNRQSQNWHQNSQNFLYSNEEDINKINKSSIPNFKNGIDILA